MPINPSLFNHSWYTFCFIVLLIFIREILKLRSGRPDYDTFLAPSNSRPILVVCLKLGLKDDDCEHLERKLPFDCEMKYGLSCHTKGWKHFKKTYVISQIQRCNLERQILVYNDTNIRPEYDIHQDLFCIRFVHPNFSFHSIPDHQYYFTFNAKSHHDYFLHIVESAKEVVKKFIWHRKCFFDQQAKQFVCRNAEIGLINAKTIRKKHTEITNCANYGRDDPYRDYSNQFECLRRCYKDLSSNTTEAQKRRCREKVCPLIDCVFNHFYVDSISKSDNELTQVTVADLQQITEVIDFIESDDVFLYVIGILSSIFGFNVLHRILWLQRKVQHQIYSLLTLAFREHHDKLKRRNEKTKRNLKILLVLIVIIICAWPLGKALHRYFKFEQKMSFFYDLSTSMVNRGITVSVCFAINDILIQANDSKSCELSNCTLRELSETTLSASDLIENAALESVIRDQVLPVNESRWFFKDKSKCFDFAFKLQETKLDYFSRLIYIGIRTKRYFNHIYLRERGLFPTYSMAKQPSPYLTIYADKRYRNNVFLNKTCENYSFERDRCHSREACVEKCIRESYLKKHPNVFSSHFVVSQEEIESNETIANRTFRSGQFAFTAMKLQCKERFLPDCEEFFYRNINITYEKVGKRLENSLDCEFRVLIFTQSSFLLFSYDFDTFIFHAFNLTNLWFGFSIPLLIKWTIAWSYCFKHKLISKILKNLLTLTVAILFIVHLKSFVDLIVCNEKVSQMHLLEASTTGVPRVSLCVKFDNQSDVSPDFNGLVPAEIDKQTPSINELVDSLHFYDSNFNEIVLDRSNFSRFLYDGNSYLKKQKRSVAKLEDAFKIKTFFLAASKCYDLINVLKYDQIDYRLQRNPPLLRVQLNSSFESVVVVLNDLERINLENWHRLHQNHNMEFTYKRLKFRYTDHLYYLKRPLELIWPRQVLRQRAYFRNLHYEFFSKYNRTTTLVPLTNASYFGLEIDNKKFKSFYTNKSAEELDLNETQKLPASYTQNQFVEIIKLTEDLSSVNAERNRTTLKVYPFFLKYSLVVTNRHTRCDLFLYFTLICTLYLNVSFVQLPFFLIQNLVYLHRLFRGCARFCCNFFKNF